MAGDTNNKSGYSYHLHAIKTFCQLGNTFCKVLTEKGSIAAETIRHNSCTTEIFILCVCIFVCEKANDSFLFLRLLRLITKYHEMVNI